MSWVDMQWYIMV